MFGGKPPLYSLPAVVRQTVTEMVNTFRTERNLKLKIEEPLDTRADRGHSSHSHFESARQIKTHLANKNYD